ncbi:transmembrane amino acid transporter protein-domain-containing protein [Jimgerdemannia flammicorona]|uniref:Transmembrane amino acid transporter protein-domain-containing protein n=1 Tax=Jimgerdemannia flammicorona TaxID=994334 RepID=A0A433QRT9_9FUNG|nr:transmembrane amino acid transporter protein-domain-containing protein [Jimgerdemannia flammicorona]
MRKKHAPFTNLTCQIPPSTAKYDDDDDDDDLGSPTFPRSPLLKPLVPALSIAEAAEDDKNDRHSIKSSHVKSTFMQSIFNSVNILIGIGIVALPYGFRCAGWVVALSVFVFCCGLTNYTAKLLAKCMDADPSAQTYGDIGAAAFGNQARVAVRILFLTDLLTASVALVILFSDTVKSLFPDLDMVTIHLGAFLILTPMVFLPIRNLSYASLISIISAASLVVVIIYDGLSKSEKPGSLRDPMETDIFPSDWKTVPLSFGLIMSSFAGHAVFPTVYKDMADPKQFNSVVNYTYAITFVVYLLMSASGYTMFGITTMQEVCLACIIEKTTCTQIAILTPFPIAPSHLRITSSDHTKPRQRPRFRPLPEQARRLAHRRQPHRQICSHPQPDQPYLGDWPAQLGQPRGLVQLWPRKAHRGTRLGQVRHQRVYHHHRDYIPRLR